MASDQAADHEGTFHTVGENECISSIGYMYGLFWKTIWEHPKNAPLRKQRGHPNVLLPGDQVFIPERRLASRDAATEKRHTFRRKSVPVYFRLRLLEQGNPQPNVPFVLTLEGTHYDGQSDSNGLIEVAVPPDAKEGSLTVGQGEDAETFSVCVGGLDPVDDKRGIRERLRNLGYECGEEDDEQLSAAISSFQIDHQLPASGEVDQNTMEALRKAHGS